MDVHLETADGPELGYRLRRSAWGHQVWPDRVPGDEHGDVEYEITREAWERAGL